MVSMEAKYLDHQSNMLSSGSSSSGSSELPFFFFFFFSFSSSAWEVGLGLETCIHLCTLAIPRALDSPGVPHSF